MSSLKVQICKRKNWCVDCDNEACFFCGDIEADCPKYECDNEKYLDCFHCEFIKQFKADCGARMEE